ncbi:MAG: hypothetical protein Q4C04_08460 [Clostridia bacterium]|nr:hypothetical protein [Clostridia bacterium]
MERVKKPFVKRWLEPIVFLCILLGAGTALAIPMGLANMLNTLMNTAYSLLIDTAFYILAIAVLTGALSALLSEFGVVDMFNRLLSPLMRPLYGLPGAASLGVVTTFLSDNPAILSLTEDRAFRGYFKDYQLVALTNLGTSFGMGLIVMSFMLGLENVAGESLLGAVMVGILGAVLGSILSTRLMLLFSGRRLGKETPPAPLPPDSSGANTENGEKPRLSMRIINAILNGGKTGVTLGLEIIPGVLIICTLVLMMTNGAPEGGVYTGAAKEGVGWLPYIADKLDFMLRPLFGLQSAQGISVPITALGSAGAAMGLVPQLLTAKTANAHDVAVFTAMCMCWSGYLSTHVAMMRKLGHSELTGKAILSHTCGGLFAGICANWLFVLFF